MDYSVRKIPTDKSKQYRTLNKCLTFFRATPKNAFTILSQGCLLYMCMMLSLMFVVYANLSYKQQQPSKASSTLDNIIQRAANAKSQNGTVDLNKYDLTNAFMRVSHSPSMILNWQLMSLQHHLKKTPSLQTIWLYSWDGWGHL
jgi:hypothetical protein